MACVLAISSQVVRGHIGLSAIVPALQRLGHEVWPAPTVLLSNHPGHPRFAPVRIAADEMGRMLDVLEANGWLGRVDAVLTGYLPSQDHVRVAASLVERLKVGRSVTFLCDPVLGDEPKGIYIDAGAARAIRDALLPLADIATPNRFELGWLTGASVETMADVEASARALGPATVVATSAAVERLSIATLMTTAAATHICASDRKDAVPHGTGDLFSGLFLGALLAGETSESALGQAVGAVDAVVEASRGQDELVLDGRAGEWAKAAPHSVLIPARGIRGWDTVHG